MTPKKIFICYRRDDAEGYAGRIYDRLHARFPGRVFMDVTGISPGADFTRVIRDTVGSCHVLLAIIGKQWLTIKDETDTLRIQRDDDYVRHEIATALYRNIAVIPVLVREAKMPSQNTLPHDLAALSNRNALEISDDDFEHDVLRLIAAIEYAMGEPRLPPAQPQPQKSKRTCLILAIVGVVVVGGGLILMVLFGAILSAGNNSNSNSNYETPTPLTSPQSNVPPNNSDDEAFNPVGDWIMQLTAEDGETHNFAINIESDYTFQYQNETGSWSYSGGQLTLTTTEGSMIFTPEARYGNGFTGHARIYGIPYQATMLRQ